MKIHKKQKIRKKRRKIKRKNRNKSAKQGVAWNLKV